jgi:adenylosuccinate lyase
MDSARSRSSPRTLDEKLPSKSAISNAPRFAKPRKPFSEGQKGSSRPLPHKANPVTSEQICGLARIVRSNAQRLSRTSLCGMSATFRIRRSSAVILADSAILTDYMLAKTIWLIDGMRVYPERMRRNLDSTKGLIFSGQLLLDLSAAGMLREDAL